MRWTAHRPAGFTAVAVVAAAAAVVARQVGRHSGATAADVARSLPGDDAVTDPTAVFDRVTTYENSPSEVWPWIAQLGKDRGGWYLPRPVAWLVPRSRQGAWAIQPELQRLTVGEVVPDWGPLPFTVHAVTAYDHLVYSAERTDDHDSGSRPLSFSWALVLRPDGAGTRLHLRLRLRSGTAFPAVLRSLGGLVDQATVALMFAGLRQRLRPDRL